MMHRSDAKAFATALEDAAAIYAVTLTAQQIEGYWRALSPRLTIDQVRTAIDLHIADPKAGRFFPRPADLLAAIQPSNGHLPADAAWAIALASYDEAETVVWTDEIARARDAARPVWDAGDEVGARVAFRAFYDLATRLAAPPVWRVSIGQDPERREAAVHRAVTMGLLTQQQAQRYLPAPAITPAMLPSNVVAHPSLGSDAQARMAELRRLLTRSSRPEPPAPAKPRRRTPPRSADEIAAALQEQSA